MAMFVVAAGVSCLPAAHLLHPRRQGGLLRPRKIEKLLQPRRVPGRSGAVAAANDAAMPLPNSQPQGGLSDLLARLGGSQAPPRLSDIVWPSLGGFMAMAAMGYVDSVLAPKGLSFTLGSFGAVCTLLFALPKAPASQKYNVFISHMGCAALGVVALAIFGPGWIARAVALSAAIAFMQYTGSIHPPAAGLPLLLLDASKLHRLQWWFVLFPGVIGCLFLFLLQEAVLYMKEKYRF